MLQIALLKELNKENKRSAYISALQRAARDREIVIEALKSMCATATNKSFTEIDEFVVKKTIGAPRKHHPTTREEIMLELNDKTDELSQTQLQNKKLAAKVHSLQRQVSEQATSVSKAAMNVRPLSSLPPLPPAIHSGGLSARTQKSQQYDERGQAGPQDPLTQARLIELEALVDVQKEEIHDLHDRLKSMSSQSRHRSAGTAAAGFDTDDTPIAAVQKLQRELSSLNDQYIGVSIRV
jgi:hypothetical protein